MKARFKRIISLFVCVHMLLGALAMVSCNMTTDSPEDITDAASKIDEQVENSKWIAAPRIIASIKKGTVITGDHVMMSVVDKEDMPSGIVTEVGDIIGKYAATDFTVGSYVYERNLSAEKVDPDPVVEELSAEQLKEQLRAELEAQLREEMAAADAKGKIKVIKLISNIKRGEQITADDIVEVMVSSIEAPENALTRADAVVGKYAKVNIYAGTYLFSTDLSMLKVDPAPAIDAETLEDIKSQVREDITEELSEKLSQELTEELSAELEEKLRKELDETYKDQLSSEIREQLEEQLRAELEAEIRNEIENRVDNAAEMGYVIITDYIELNTGKDVSSAIQSVINTNPNRTIYFPDGEYILSKPIKTSANPVNSVSLHLSNYATFKASSTWNYEDTQALVMLGGAEHYNSIYINGSNYYFYGGILDGNGVATGISIESGRETSIRNVSIKNTQIGIYVKDGANSHSSDADIDTVNIVGNNKVDSVGVYCIGYDNTFTNMRIAKVQKGFYLQGAGNFLRNIHPLMTYGGIEYDYVDSIGFDDASGGNWYDFCYSDQFAVGFRMRGGTLSTYQTCFCFWYKKDVMQVGFKSVNKDNTNQLAKMNSTIWNSKVNLNDTGVANGVVVPSGTTIVRAYLQATTGGGGRIECPIFYTGNDNVKHYQNYLKGDVMWTK